MTKQKPSQQELEQAVKTIISSFDDPEREGLQDTPRRYIKFLSEFITPEEPDFKCTTFGIEKYDEMITMKDIPFHSLCEHHLAPFMGVAHIGYIPNDKIVGLSKLPRTLDFFARKFQNQERITHQVAQYLFDKLQPRGVAVVIEAKHLCVEMRGIKKHDAFTTTAAMLGVFKENASCKNEFLNYIK